MNATRPGSILFALTLTLLFTPVCEALGYPEKPIRVVVGFAPGGSNDIVARIIGQKLSENIGYPVVVDNRPGAAGNIATEIAARAQPDGYTVLMIGANNTINAALGAKLPYDIVADFAPVIRAVSVPLVLVVHPSLKVRTITDFVNLAKSRPGQLNYASSGTGSISHLAAELFKSMTKTDIVHVPYKGSSPGETDLMAGRVQVLFTGLAHTLPHIRAGRLSALGVTSARRVSVAANLPTIAEAGVSGYESSTWYGFAAPVTTPGAVVAKLNAEIHKVLQMPEVRQNLQRQGLEPVGGTPAELGAYLRSDLAKWSKVVREAGITSN